MSDVVAVEYELSQEDWISAMESYVRDSRTDGNALRAIRLAFGLTVSALVLLLLWGGSLTSALIAAVLGTAWIVAAPALTRKRQARHLRKIADEGVAHGTFGPHRVVLTDDGILDSAEGYDRLIHWNAVDRVEDSGRVLLVYNGPHSFLPIPLSAFPDRATFEAFSDRFFRGLEDAGRLGPPGDGGGSPAEPSRPAP